MSVLDGDVSAHFCNATLRTLATRPAPHSPWPTGDWIIPQWENFWAQEGQNPAILYDQPTLMNPASYPALPRSWSPCSSYTAQAHPQSRKAPVWMTDTKRNPEGVKATKLAGKLVLKNSIICPCRYLVPSKKKDFKKSFQKKKDSYKLKILW